ALHLEEIGMTFAVMALPIDHPLAGTVQPLAAFRDEPFITINESAFPGTRQYLLKFCADAGFRPRIVHEALQPIDVLNLVAIGEGVAIVPEQMRRLPVEGVVFCELGGPVPRIATYVAWQEGRATKELLAFVKAAKDSYARLIREGAPPRR